jgi:hypothetical protein
VNIFKVFGFLLVGFSGGCIAPWFVSWLNKASAVSATDAVSIANTYIVFTTIIFVGFTVVLGVAGYFFTQQFAANKDAEQKEVFSQIKQKLKDDEKLGIDLLKSLLDNSDVKEHIEDVLNWKIDELIDSRASDSEALASQAAQDAASIRGLSSQLKNGISHDSKSPV